MDRRRLLQGAAAATTAGVLLPAARAQAAAFADTDHPSAHWTPATTANYTASSRPSAYPVHHVVIHVTQETFDRHDRHLPEPGQAGVRALCGALCGRPCRAVRTGAQHRLARGQLGLQHPQHRHRARGLGRPARVLHARAVRTVRGAHRLGLRPYGIPKDRAHIIGHNEVPGTDHTDPGPLLGLGALHPPRQLRLTRADARRRRNGSSVRRRCVGQRWAAGGRVERPMGGPGVRARIRPSGSPCCAGRTRRYLTAGRVERPVRSVVADSWRRSARAQVSPEGTAGVELDADGAGAVPRGASAGAGDAAGPGVDGRVRQRTASIWLRSATRTGGCCGSKGPRPRAAGRAG